MNDQEPIERNDPERLASLLPLDGAEPALWSPEEMEDLMLHALSVPIGYELSGLGVARAEAVEALCSARGLMVRSFADLLLHPQPPPELLVLTKNYAKLVREHPDSPLPPEAAMVLYYASIAAARLRCGRRISRLDDRDLCRGLAQMTTFPWLPERMRALFQEALAALGGGPSQGN